MADLNEDTARKWVDDNGDWFERAVLWFAIHDMGMWKWLSSVVCIAAGGGMSRDFSAPIYTAVYLTIAKQRAALGIRVQGKVSREAYVLGVQTAASEGKIMGLSEVPSAVALYDELSVQDYSQLQEVVRVGLSYWLSKQRAGVLLTSVLAYRDWSAGNLLDRLSAEVGHVSSKLAPTGHVSEFATSLMNRRNTKVECLASGLHGLDMLLGGGFHKGDGHLVIAAPGVGKTVFSSQLAMDFALRNHVVCLITTEQPMDQLEPRWVANKCGVAYDTIARGFTLHTLPPAAREKALRLMRSVANRLFVFDWRKHRKSVLGGGIEEEIHTCQERAGRCDVVILDWLGGALTDDVRDDKDKKRLAIQNTADRMAYLAHEHHLPTITLCQAHKVKGVNNMYVGVAEVPDCKTVDQAMAAVIGVTGMFSDEAKQKIREGGDPHGIGLYGDKQYFFMSKGRHSVGGHAVFRRNFRYMRMEDY